jgi:hypothetical protein
MIKEVDINITVPASWRDEKKGTHMEMRAAGAQLFIGCFNEDVVWGVLRCMLLHKTHLQL